jgi:VanZ family protein
MLPMKRLVAWTTLVLIVVLTVVPPDLRPETPIPHGVEHASIFLIAGFLFGTAYMGREWILSAGGIAFCAAIEALQLHTPGRHARVSDFVIDVAAAIAGVFVGAFVHRVGAKIQDRLKKQ